MKKRILDPKLIVASILLVGLLALNAVFSYHNLQKLYANTEWVLHTHQVIETTERIVTLVVSAESGQRGYIITGDQQYEISRRTMSEVSEQFKLLEGYVRDNMEQFSRVKTLKTTVDRRLEILNRNSRLMKEKGLKAVQKSIATGEGKLEMERVLEKANDIINVENTLLRERTHNVEEVFHNTIVTSLITNLIALIMLAAFLLIFRIHLVSRNKAENILFEERELFRFTINSIGDAVVTTDQEARITSLNWVAQSLTGLTVEEVVGQPISDVFRLINEQTRRPIENPILQVLEEGRVIRMANHAILIAQNGTEIFIEDSAAPIRDKDSHIVGAVLVFRDVTEDKKTDEARRRLAAIVNSSEDAIISKNLKGIITSWNEGAERIFGYTAQEAVNQSILMLIPQERRHEEMEIIRRIHLGEHVEHFETVRQRKDGSLIHVSLSISPIKGANNTIIGASKIARDITKKHKLEEALKESEASLRKLSENLSNSNKELEQFAYVASHDLKEPLHLISSFADLLVRRAGGKLETKEVEYLNTIKQVAVQGTTLIKELLEFSRIGKAQVLGPVNLSEVIQKVKINLNLLINETEARIECSEPLPYIKGTSMEMGQLFQNLIENSIKYRGPDPVVIHISASRAEHNMWLLGVKDNGIGIDPEYRERIFDIFERLHAKNEYSGTGIGLAICKKIVQHYGGKIWVESEPGKGSTFCFTLPGV